jgi:hypothetical protein
MGCSALFDCLRAQISTAGASRQPASSLARATLMVGGSLLALT